MMPRPCDSYCCVLPKGTLLICSLVGTEENGNLCVFSTSILSILGLILSCGKKASLPAEKFTGLSEQGDEQKDLNGVAWIQPGMQWGMDEGDWPLRAEAGKESRVLPSLGKREALSMQVWETLSIKNLQAISRCPKMTSLLRGPRECLWSSQDVSSPS